jgi:hypothetical protein
VRGGLGRRTDPNDPRTGFRRIVQNTLAYIVVEMGAVVVGFDGGARWVVRVGVEGVEVGADAFYWGKVLDWWLEDRKEEWDRERWLGGGV